MEKKKVLIIDDDVRFTDIVKLNLEKSGKYEIRVENNGGSAVYAAEEFEPGLILLDIIMPDVSGDVVASRLSASPKTKSIPIVFLTAVVTKEEETSHGGVIGGKKFVAKPLTAEELMGVIEENYKAA